MTSRSEKTIRELIRGIFVAIRDTEDLLPDHAANLQVKLAALLPNVLEELREADIDYRKVYLACLNEHGKANRARIEAETRPEYARLREAKDTEQVTVEMIRSLKAYLKSKQEELRLAR